MLAALLGQLWDSSDHMGRGWWWVMGIGWLTFLALVAIVIIIAVRHFTNGKPRTGTAEDLLAERFARGEIDDDEYRTRRAALRE